MNPLAGASHERIPPEFAGALRRRRGRPVRPRAIGTNVIRRRMLTTRVALVRSLAHRARSTSAPFRRPRDDSVRCEGTARHHDLYSTVTRMLRGSAAICGGHGGADACHVDARCRYTLADQRVANGDCTAQREVLVRGSAACTVGMALHVETQIRIRGYDPGEPCDALARGRADASRPGRELYTTNVRHQTAVRCSSRQHSVEAIVQFGPRSRDRRRALGRICLALAGS